MAVPTASHQNLLGHYQLSVAANLLLLALIANQNSRFKGQLLK